MALNDQQELFCKEYLIDGKPVSAALRAGYSKSTALGASKWLKDDPKKPKTKYKPEIVARIAELMAEKDAALIATADEVLKTLTRILRREESEQIVITTSEKTPAIIPETGRVSYTTREIPKVVEVKPKLSDVNRAAELLGKRYGLYTEKVELTDETPMIVDDVRLTPMEGDPDGGIKRERRQTDA